MELFSKLKLYLHLLNSYIKNYFWIELCVKKKGAEFELFEIEMFLTIKLCTHAKLNGLK